MGGVAIAQIGLATVIANNTFSASGAVSALVNENGGAGTPSFGSDCVSNRGVCSGLYLYGNQSVSLIMEYTLVLNNSASISGNRGSTNLNGGAGMFYHCCR